jgi:hypothetical protein
VIFPIDVGGDAGSRFHVIDRLVKIAQITQGFFTPIIAILLGAITYLLQRRQTKTQERQYRLALLERRMKVFDAVMELVALVVQDSRIQTIEPLTKLLRETREHHLLFRQEIGDYIQKELYSKALRLHTIYEMSGPQQVMRQEDIPIHGVIVEWFALQFRVAEQMFLPYIDFREP